MPSKDNLLKAKNYLKQRSHHLSAIVFIFGFFLDAFTLPNVTDKWSYIVGIIYACIVGVLIFSREYTRSDRLNFKNEHLYVSWSSIATSFFMGSLTSFVFIYYLRGADVLSGLPILIFILSVMIANEFANFREKFIFDLLVYSVSIVFLFVFMLPVLFKSMGDIVFVISVLAASLFLYFYTRYIYDLNPKIFKIKIYNYILVLPALVTGLYFTNLIPAVPLTLRVKEIYAGVTKSGKEYVFANKCDYSFNPFAYCTLQLSDIVNSRATFYTEIQAPADLSAGVTHSWEYYDEKKEQWVNRGKISYEISGGRGDGYRGYTNITTREPGLYKVTAIINDKRILGSKKFYIK